jgi:hypothetical protein
VIRQQPKPWRALGSFVRACRPALRRTLPVLPLLLGLACLALFDASEQTAPPQVEPAPSARPTRLIVFMVDSLDRRDVESSSSLPLLHGRLAKAGLSGPVSACVDGVTIPCVSAMVTGFDRASGFSPLRNFGAARGLAERSVLGALEQRKHRVGYFGDALLAKALDGLTVVEAPLRDDQPDDGETLRVAFDSLARDELELVFVHLLSLDETAHKFTATGPAYREALGQLDARLEQAFGRLRADDHVAILGDHGHSETGRHSAGLGTETYAAYFGPQFVHKLQRPLAMTDHARVWARLFGLHWGERSWVDDYFDRPAAQPETAQPPALAVRSRSAGPLVVVLLLAVLLAAAGARTDPAVPLHWSARRGAALALGIAAMLALSFAVPLVWHWLATDAGAIALALIVGLMGAGVLWLWSGAPAQAGERGPERASGLLVAGAVLWALPTAEPTAGLKSPVLWLVAVLMVLFVRAVRAREPLRGLRTLVCLVALLLLALVRVQDYLPRMFMTDGAGPLLGRVVPGLLVAGAVFAAGGARSALLATLGWLVAQLFADATDRWLLLPCASILLLSFAAFRRAALFDLACFLLPLACGCFFQRESAQYASVATTWLLWSVLPRLTANESSLMRGGCCVLLMWLSFWTAMSSRVGGIDYDFYFRWLPAGAAAMSDAVQQGLLTAAKCMLPTVFGALLAHRVGGLPIEVIRSAEHLTRVRLSLSIVFVAGLSLARGAADVHLLYDATQEIAFWLLVFAVLGLIAAVTQVGTRRAVSTRRSAAATTAP